jgi:hypothetical protein
MNKDNPLRDGIPNDNNIHFVDEFRDYLPYRDLTFIGQMNSCCELSFLSSYYVFCIYNNSLEAQYNSRGAVNIQ